MPADSASVPATAVCVPAAHRTEKVEKPVIVSSGVATVGHGWARAHPTSARVGSEIFTNLKSFGE